MKILVEGQKWNTKWKCCGPDDCQNRVFFFLQLGGSIICLCKDCARLLRAILEVEV